MNEDELAQIEQRYAAADKVAPMSNWQFVDSECNCDCGHVRFDDDDNDIEIDCESGECAECLKELKANQSGLLTQTDGDYWYFHPRTLMFILACRADIPALIAEVRRLRELIMLVARSQREPWDMVLFDEAYDAVTEVEKTWTTTTS